jgi:hypothetical protein
MLGMTYFSVGGLGLLIYREYRKKVRADQSAAPSPLPLSPLGERGEGGGTEDLSCSDQSPAGTS